MKFILNLTAERSVVRESVKGIIWSIFFYRLFGPIEPATDEFLGITYPTATHLPELDSLIDEKVDQLLRKYFHSSASSEQQQEEVSPYGLVSSNPGIYEDRNVKWGHVKIRFFDKQVTKSKKKTGWFGQGKNDDTEDTKLWETWIINIKCLPLDSQFESPMKVSAHSFEETLLKIITIADSNKEHIPPITSLDTSPFPYTIDVEQELEAANDDDASWGTYIKKILD